MSLCASARANNSGSNGGTPGPPTLRPSDPPTIMAAEPSEGPRGGPAPPERAALGPHQPDITELKRFFFGQRALFSIAMTGVLVLGLIVFARAAKPFLMPIVLALLLNFLLKPMVSALCRVHLHRA